MTIGEFIRKKRLAIGMSQATLYKALHLAQTGKHAGRPVISKMERNQSALSFEQFCKIAEALGYKASEFLQEFENATYTG